MGPAAFTLFQYAQDFVNPSSVSPYVDNTYAYGNEPSAVYWLEHNLNAPTVPPQTLKTTPLFSAAGDTNGVLYMSTYGGVPQAQPLQFGRRLAIGGIASLTLRMRLKVGYDATDGGGPAVPNPLMELSLFNFFTGDSQTTQYFVGVDINTALPSGRQLDPWYTRNMAVITPTATTTPVTLQGLLPAVTNGSVSLDNNVLDYAESDWVELTCTWSPGNPVAVALDGVSVATFPDPGLGVTHVDVLSAVVWPSRADPAAVQTGLGRTGLLVDWVYIAATQGSTRPF